MADATGRRPHGSERAALPPLPLLKRLQNEGDVVVFRGRRERDRAASGVLVVVPAADPPAPATVDRLAHEYALSAELNPEWAAKPVDFVREDGGARLVLEDPGGVPLEQLLGQPMETGRFLRLAVALVEAIGKVHERGLIHRDLRPANILIDEAAGCVHLTGFGLASRQPREHPTPDHAELFAQALAYMAPEQTGRMNRSVDARSDLYALGVVLYEMLTGALPFHASDPVEWVHCHIARAPVPPLQRVPQAPEAISAIILKCLAKTAEDRYQTAAGLAADLKLCLEEWERDGSIAPLTPGARDVPDTLRIPEKLYGREAEVGRLLQAFDRVVATGAPELVVVSGYSGVGKSSVVNELHKALVPQRGLFAGGKFDQYKRDIPYATLAQAFQSLIRQLLGKSGAELDRWRGALRAALGPNAALLLTLAPDLELILGELKPVPDLPSPEAEHRFRRVLRRFVGVFARPEHPLALFLDDMQWLDAATLNLLSDLATQPEMGSLLIVGAYRDNEVDAAHPLRRSLDQIRPTGRVSEIVLSPLGRADVGRLVADSLNCTEDGSAPLADLVYDKAAGNPFFTIQFLTALAEEKLLVFSPGARRWTWDLKRIRAKRYTDNVADLMVDKISRLPPQAQDALQQLAVLGDRAEVSWLGLVLGRPPEGVHAALWEAVQTGLVLVQEETYVFLHDRVREAAYQLIPEASRAERHLRAGRALSASLGPAEIRERIFDVVSQLDRGLQLIEAPEERERVAALNLIAGERAKAAVAHAAARTYFAAGSELLADGREARRSGLAFALELNRAECEFLTGALAEAGARLNALSGRAADTIDLARVVSLQLDLLIVIGEIEAAIGVGLDYLNRTGADWQAHPSAEEVRDEYERVWAQIGSRAIGSLIDLPLMSDPSTLATMDILTKFATAANFCEPNLQGLAAARAVNLSLEQGVCDATCPHLEWLAMIAGVRFDDYEGGFLLGQLGYDLVERRGLKRFHARTMMLFGVEVMPWTHHVRSVLDLSRRSVDLAMESGDWAYAGYSWEGTIEKMLMAGSPLGEVQQEAEAGLAFSNKLGFASFIDLFAVVVALACMLRGQTPEFGSLDCEQFDESEYEQAIMGRRGQELVLVFYLLKKIEARVYAGQYSEAIDAIEKVDGWIWLFELLVEQTNYHFYGGLAHAAWCDSVAPAERRKHLEKALGHHRKLAHWAEICPENFADRAALVGAEIARVEGRIPQAERLYEQAIRAAADSGFFHHEALAEERAGRFYLARGLEAAGLGLLREARCCYERWGADGKVRQLEQAYPQLARDPLPAAAGPGGGRLDLAAVIRTSQAISGEIELPRLIQTLMTITLQSAGADRGLLLLPAGGAFRIEAEASARGGAVEVSLRHDAPTEQDCPEALVNYVVHTRENVILDDASRARPGWEGSAYLRGGGPRSVLCLPLLRQGELGGVLYLENRQATYAFTPERVALLETLAARAAIALENARLYGDLQRREAKIRRLVDSNIIGILVGAADGRIIEANDAFLALTGYSRDDVLTGGVRWTDMSPADWWEADARAAEQIAATGNCPPYEKEFFRKDGSRIPVLLGATALEGGQQALAFVLDLTERKQAEERQKVMLGELNHRVKNTLATVQAIASQTFRTATSPEAFRKGFEGRLTALSQTHNLLNRNFWTGVDLRDLVHEELAPFIGEDDSRVELTGGPVRLGPIAAVTLGMGFHELATNAAKYGALSVPTGRVEVAWRAAEPGRLHLEWRETGGPKVEPSQRAGFGSRLLTQVLSAELRGKVHLDFRPEGVRCAMDMAPEQVAGH